MLGGWCYDFVRGLPRFVTSLGAVTLSAYRCRTDGRTQLRGIRRRKSIGVS